MSGLKPLMRETREAVLKGAARAKDRLHQVADNMNDHVDDVARRVRAQDKFDDKPSLPPKNEIPLINGRRPINSKYAGRVFDGDKWSPDLAKKYPDGVRFTNEGFPDFSPYSRVSLNRISMGAVTALQRTTQISWLFLKVLNFRRTDAHRSLD